MDPARISLQEDRLGLTGMAFRYGNQATYLGSIDNDHRWAVAILIGPDDEVQTVEIDASGAKTSSTLPAGELFEGLEILAADGPEAFTIAAALALSGLELRGADEVRSRQFAALLRRAADDLGWSLPVRLANQDRELHLSEQGRGILRHLAEMVERDNRAMTTMPAARRLELSEAARDALRTRVQRANLQAYRVQGRWYVVMANLSRDRAASSNGASSSSSAGATLDRPTSEPTLAGKEREPGAIQAMPDVAEAAQGNQAPSEAASSLEPATGASTTPALESGPSGQAVADQQHPPVADTTQEAGAGATGDLPGRETHEPIATAAPERPRPATPFSEDELAAAVRLMSGRDEPSRPVSQASAPAEPAAAVDLPAASVSSDTPVPQAEDTGLRAAPPHGAVGADTDTAAGSNMNTDTNTDTDTDPDTDTDTDPDTGADAGVLYRRVTARRGERRSDHGSPDNGSVPGTDQAGTTHDLIDHLRGEVDFLRSQLVGKDSQIAAWIEEGNRKDVVIARLERRVLETPGASDDARGLALQQLEAVRDEWLQPFVDQIRALEKEVGRLEAELAERQASALAEIRHERDALRERVEALERELEALRSSLVGSAGSANGLYHPQRRLPWYRRLFGTAANEQSP